MLAFSGCREFKKPAGKEVFRYNEAAGISSLDPAFARNLPNIWACNQLFNGLVQLDSMLNVQPCIAKRWEISENGKTYTFYLRDDVFFHEHPLLITADQQRVTADDFVYTFRRLLDEKVASPGSWVFNNVDSTGGKSDFLALNDSTLQIKLKKAFPPFLGILAMQYCAVIPEEVVEHFGKDFRMNPVGTGPFFFKYWQEGVKLVLLKNENYFEKDPEGISLPYLDAISVSFLKDKQSAFLEFVKGNLDFMSGIDPNYKDELLSPEGLLSQKYEEEIYLLRQDYLNTEYLGMLVDTALPIVKNSPLNLKKIRQAINYGFNRKEMIRYLRNGIGSPGNYGMIPLGLPSFDSARINGYAYDPDKARMLLQEAGFPNGENLPGISLVTTSEYLDLCKYIQHQLSGIGIDLAIEVNTPGAVREMKANAKTSFFRASWIADYPDAENYLSLFYSGNFSPDGPNYTHYSNAVFDSLYLDSQNQINDTLRYDLYRKMDNMVMEDAPVVVLYYDQVLRFVRNNISGLGSNPVNMLDLRRVKKAS